MNILATQYSLSTKSLDIYLAGCAGPHCEQCHNPESWDFNQGTSWEELWYEIEKKVTFSDKLVDRLFIMGGEPLDQDPGELEKLLQKCHNLKKEVWLFTGKSDYKWFPFDSKLLCHYIKIGPYDPENKVDDYYCYGIKLASSNQKILRRGYDY